MKLIIPKVKNAGDLKQIAAEEDVADVKFTVHKFNNRPKPDSTDRILIFSCFSEFGCEIVGAMYCIPKLLQKEAGKYTIAMGWHGRAYLYRHLVDEFWEIDESCQWLREYCRAFHHESKNLRKLEKVAANQGKLISADAMGRIAIGNRCLKCKAFWGDWHYISECKYCKSKDVERSLFGDVSYWKNYVKLIPKPSSEKLQQADTYLKPNPVGIFARGRKCYGRNLQPEFYVKLIELLEGMGFNPIWLGEKQSTQPCPVDHIIDFSRMPESRDLELTLAIVSKLKFSIQFWTASSRLSAIMGTPYLLFESPDQIWGNGQEGYRRQLCEFGPSKLAVCHYLNVFNDNQSGLNLAKRCIEEMNQGNFEDVLDLLESEHIVKQMKNNHLKRSRSQWIQ